MTVGEPSVRLLDVVRSRVDADSSLDTAAALLVLAALEGGEALDQALDGVPAAESPPAGTGAEPRDDSEPAGAYITSLEVEGFRGIGEPSALPLNAGPGLTLVVGRNGSGKSSFAEALEILVTGANSRWEQRSAVWKQGWRNLHWSGPVRIEAEFALEGEAGRVTIRREWSATEEDVARSTAAVRRRQGPDEPLSALGWHAALATYRPFLPYNELGAVADFRPSDLFDTLSAALGLEPLVDGRELLRQKRLERERLVRESTEALTSLRPRLAVVEDERAQKCARALETSQWDLDTVELVLEGAVESSSEGVLDILRQLATVQSPDPAMVEAATEALRAAADEVEAAAATDAGRSQQLAELLQRALDLHAKHGDQRCPVCGTGDLGGAWREQALVEIARLREAASAATSAHTSLQQAIRNARALLVAAPDAVRRASDVGIEVADLLQAWERWRSPDSEASGSALGAHLQDAYPSLTAELAKVREAARAELERREDIWRPVAGALREWLPRARQAARARSAVPTLRSAQTWLDAATDDIRAERFRPISEQATLVWEQLRQNSNVSLDRLALAGSDTRRRVELDVTVDGVPGAALGVMSQGEIHSLALSLFLPRVILPETPFRFVVIDDPVQAMDPSKVDGLARVLEMVSASRQVVVFTHDDRLPESLRRLRIPVHVVEVTRRANSVVECRTVSDPIQQYLNDARAVVRTEGLPAGVPERVVPGFCRLAVEAACTETVRRRRIGRGEAHSEVETTVAAATTLLEKLSLGLFDETGRAGEVMQRVQARWGRSAADAVGMANRGSHAGLPAGVLSGLIEDTSRLTEQIRSLA